VLWFNLESGHLSGFATFFASYANVGLDHAVWTNGFVAITAREAGLNVRMPITMISV
jgi:hypothetical protein